MARHRVCFAAAALAGHRLVHGHSEQQPKIASSVLQPRVPTTVFVHGLDSSKQTWTSVQADLVRQGLPCLALDLRGHGESELGDRAGFTPEALARDVIRAVEEHGVKNPWILVGHSMGGRVAMRVAAIAAESDRPLLAACIVEDMDAIPRTYGNIEESRPFDRSFASWSEARDALVARGYDLPRVESWRGVRVRHLVDGTWWSDINPEAQNLARDRILGSNDGDVAWQTLSRYEDTLPFGVSLWVAGDRGTACDWDGPGGILDLKRRLPRASIVKFENADHSIHNTARPEFVRELVSIINAASRKNA